MGSRTRLLTSFALLVACGLAAQEANLIEQRRNLPARVGPHAIKGHDRPDLRRDWNLQWFGGRLSPEYLDYKNQLAQEEVSRWSHLLPRPVTVHRLPATAALAAPAAGPTWTNLGPKANLTTASFPDIDSGRPAAILSDPSAPNTLYLATSGGGVFKSTDADPASGSDWTWTAITDGLPSSGSGGNVSVGAMALSPASSSTLYLGAGDAFDAEGRGFYTTTDGGVNWTVATGLGNATRSYAILPLDASKIFWGTNDGLKVSTDGGSSFAPVTVGGAATGKIRSLQKVTTTDLVCSLQPGTGAGTIHYSSNGGTTWTQATITGVTLANVGRVTVAAAGDGITLWAIYEDTALLEVTRSTIIARGVLKSSDKGQSWSWVAAPTVSGGLFQGTGNQMTSDGGQGFYNHGLAVDPNNPNRLFVGSNLALYRSLDGGANWTQLTHWYGNKHVYAHADFHTTAWSSTGSTLYVGNDGGLCVVRDPFLATVPTGSSTVASVPTFIDNRRNRGLASHLVYNLGSTLAATPADAKFRISLGMQDNGTRVRRDEGAGLQASATFEDGIGGDGFGTVIHPTDGNKILGSVYYTDIQLSTDGGATFSDSIAGITEANSDTLAPFQARLALGDTAHPDSVYTATNGKVYKSANFGGTWAALGTTGLPAGGTGSQTDPNDALYIRNIGASPSDANVLGIAANQGRFFFTANGGSSWTQAGMPANNGSYTSYVWFDRVNPAVVYAASVAPSGTKNHLWKSTNSGASWTTLDGSAAAPNGLPFGIPVHVVQTDPTDPNTLYAGTDFGVYASTNGGTSWARYGAGLPMVAVRDLYLAPDGSFIRAATFGRGVWEASMAPLGPTVTLAPASVTMIQGGTQDFTPTVSGGTANTVTWSATSGTIAAGPTATAVAHTYTAPATGSSATVTATTVDAPVATATATVTLVAPGAVTVAVSPAAVELMTGTSTQQFSAAVSPLTSQGVAWTGTGVSSLGLFDATGLAAGSYTVTATSVASPTSPAGTATVTLVSPASVTVAVAPATANLVTGGTRQFAATVTGVSAANQGVTWSVSPAATISGTGLFTANAVGTFTVTATNSFSGATGTATVVVKSRDVDGNGIVEPLDLLFFAKHYGTANAACDLNGDGTVNDADLDLLIAGL